LVNILNFEKNAKTKAVDNVLNPLNAELNPIRHLLALVEAHHILHVSRIMVKRSVSKNLISAKLGITEKFPMFVLKHEYYVMEKDVTLINANIGGGNLATY
jgi:hypothetical protein